MRGGWGGGLFSAFPVRNALTRDKTHYKGWACGVGYSKPKQVKTQEGVGTCVGVLDAGAVRARSRTLQKGGGIGVCESTALLHTIFTTITITRHPCKPPTFPPPAPLLLQARAAAGDAHTHMDVDGDGGGGGGEEREDAAGGGGAGARYLTSSKLFGLQLRDCTFRWVHANGVAVLCGCVCIITTRRDGLRDYE